MRKMLSGRERPEETSAGDDPYKTALVHHLSVAIDRKVEEQNFHVADQFCTVSTYPWFVPTDGTE